MTANKAERRRCNHFVHSSNYASQPYCCRNRSRSLKMKSARFEKPSVPRGKHASAPLNRSQKSAATHQTLQLKRWRAWSSSYLDPPELCFFLVFAVLFLLCAARSPLCAHAPRLLSDEIVAARMIRTACRRRHHLRTQSASWFGIDLINKFDQLPVIGVA